MTKKCTDCKHGEMDIIDTMHCVFSRKINPYTGVLNSESSGEYCRTERARGCGIDAINFNKPIPVPDNLSDKLCKDCVYFDNFGCGLDSCLAIPSHDPITGDAMSEFCDHERSSGSCGREGKNYKEKKTSVKVVKTFWQTLFGK